MKVALFEPNLFWAAKVRSAIVAAGWECVVASEGQWRDVRALVVGLYAPEEALRRVVAEARRNRLPVVGHAGHKEKALLNLGRELGCDRVLTNGELAHRLKAHLQAVLEGPFRESKGSDG